MKPKREAEFDAEMVRNISEAVYRDRLGETDTASMLTKDNDGGKKLRERAGTYDALTRSYLRVIRETHETPQRPHPPVDQGDQDMPCP